MVFAFCYSNLIPNVTWTDYTKNRSSWAVLSQLNSRVGAEHDSCFATCSLQADARQLKKAQSTMSDVAYGKSYDPSPPFFKVTERNQYPATGRRCYCKFRTKLDTGKKIVLLFNFASKILPEPP